MKECIEHTLFLDKLEVFVEQYHDWVIENSKYRCDETRRSGKSKYSQDSSSGDGSFRKLEID